eukprot:scaffold85995_cov17-Tisochrysis_lutea.AAC.1
MRMRSKKASRQPSRSDIGRSQLCSPHTPPRSDWSACTPHDRQKNTTGRSQRCSPHMPPRSACICMAGHAGQPAFHMVSRTWGTASNATHTHTPPKPLL